MRFIRQFSSIPKKNASPLIQLNNTSIYPLGETEKPFFKNLTWHINEQETWAVVGPASSGRRVLLEVRRPHFQLTGL
jgi:ABC-type molybdenum transport system ATPase subunit/photorepair protein PhrA